MAARYWVPKCPGDSNADFEPKQTPDSPALVEPGKHVVVQEVDFLCGAHLYCDVSNGLRSLDSTTAEGQSREMFVLILVCCSITFTVSLAS